MRPGRPTPRFGHANGTRCPVPIPPPPSPRSTSPHTHTTSTLLQLSTNDKSIGTIARPLITNDTGNVIDFGVSNVTSYQLSLLKGNYLRVPESEITNDAVILKCLFIPKPDRYGTGRLITCTSTSYLLEKGVTIPTEMINLDSKLDIKRTFSIFFGNIAKAPLGVKLAAIDLSNAYANICCIMRLYIRTIDGVLYRLNMTQ